MVAEAARLDRFGVQLLDGENVVEAFQEGVGLVDNAEGLSHGFALTDRRLFHVIREWNSGSTSVAMLTDVQHLDIDYRGITWWAVGLGAVLTLVGLLAALQFQSDGFRTAVGVALAFGGAVMAVFVYLRSGNTHLHTHLGHRAVSVRVGHAARDQAQEFMVAFFEAKARCKSRRL